MQIRRSVKELGHEPQMDNYGTYISYSMTSPVIKLLAVILLERTEEVSKMFAPGS
jgi:hypothetical protein